MSFFYDLNKKLAALSAKTESKQITESAAVEESKFSKLAKEIGKNPKVKNPAAVAATIGREKYGQKAMTAKAVAGKKKANEEELDEAGYSAKAGRAGKDLGKPGKAFAKIAKGAAERYGSKEAGERVAGAVLKKLRAKESEEMTDEGNAFTGALAKTPKGGKFKVGNKEFTDTSDLEEGYAEMDAWLAQREKEKGTGKFDVKDTGYSKRYTRKEEPEAADDEEVSTEPKRRGRPKGAPKGPERTTAKAWKHKGARKEKTEEDLDTDGVMMTRPTNCSSEAPGDDSAIKSAIKLLKKNGYNVAKKEEMDEKAPPGAKAERMVKHIKKSLSKDGHLSNKDKAIAYATTWKAHNQGKVEEESTAEKDDKAERAAKKVAKDIEYDEGHKGKDDNKAERAGKKVKKDIEYDDKKDKEEKVDETTVSGSIATATAAPKANKGGIQFGKGVYESLDQQFKQALTESIHVQETVEECDMGGQSITIQADGEEAAKLMALLKLAGLEVCSSCGKAPCGCESLEENQPDWPTDTETLAAEPNLRTYSGGLNGPKSTGQTTTPVIASQLRRQASMEESVELERNLFKLYKDMSGK